MQCTLPVRCKQSRKCKKKVMKMHGFLMLIIKLLPQNLWKHLLNCLAEIFYTIFFKTVIHQSWFTDAIPCTLGHVIAEMNSHLKDVVIQSTNFINFLATYTSICINKGHTKFSLHYKYNLYM